jgi:hypothetical protein
MQKKVHGDKYDYSLVEYAKSVSKVKIICNVCRKVFEQAPVNHKQGQGCPNCNGKYSIQLDTESFIKKAIEVHQNKYSYEKVDYKCMRSKIIIICNFCKKEFSQVPYAHLRGQGCPFCHNRHSKETNLKKYGFESAIQSREIKEKMINTMIEKYGNVHPFSKCQYKFEDLLFDSSWELTYYVFHKNKGENIARNFDGSEYQFEGISRLFYPDFKINNEYIEIKGEHLMKGFYGERSIVKFNSFQNMTWVINREQLKEEFQYMKDVFGKQWITKFRLTKSAKKED